jgi:large subunit ribosomal protein L5
MLTLCYTHVIPGSKAPDPVDRMRPWVGDSPYFENRPPKGPRGRREVLRPLHKPINFRNIPQLKKVTVHAHVPEATSNSGWLHAASIALQSITNVRATTHIAKKNVMEWGARKGRYVSLTVDMEGENMYDFLGKLIQIVMPRIKDWKGVSGGSGDSTGNISFGLGKEDVALFPEIEVNYDMYPAQMIPGCHVTIHTTAVTDREARLLMTSMGIPFHGKLIKR